MPICLESPYRQQCLRTSFSVWHTNIVADRVQSLLCSLDCFVGLLRDNSAMRRSRAHGHSSSLSASCALLDLVRSRRVSGPNGGPRGSSVHRTIHSEIRAQINDVSVLSVLKYRVSNKAGRHVPRRRTPCFTIVIAYEKKTPTGSCVNGRGVDSIRHLAISNNHVGESATVTAVSRSEVLSAVIRNHHTVVIRTDVDSFRTRRMNRD